jgi:hypothetical protein
MVFVPINRKHIYRSSKMMVGGSIIKTGAKPLDEPASILGDNYLRKANVVGGILNTSKIDHTQNKPTLKHSVLSKPEPILTKPKVINGAGLLKLVTVPSIKNAKKQRNSLKIAL